MVSERLFDHALMYMTHTRSGHEDFLTHVHCVDQCETTQAVIPPWSESESSETSSHDASDATSAESSSEP
jgi:hypothetical protein